MLPCGRCQEANPDGARFCHACGASHATAEAPNRERKLVSVVFVDVVGSTGFGDEADLFFALRRLLTAFAATRPLLLTPDNSRHFLAAEPVRDLLRASGR